MFISAHVCLIASEIIRECHPLELEPQMIVSCRVGAEKQVHCSQLSPERQICKVTSAGGGQTNFRSQIFSSMES